MRASVRMILGAVWHSGVTDTLTVKAEEVLALREPATRGHLLWEGPARSEERSQRNEVCQHEGKRPEDGEVATKGSVALDSGDEREVGAGGRKRSRDRGAARSSSGRQAAEVAVDQGAGCTVRQDKAVASGS